MRGIDLLLVFAPHAVVIIAITIRVISRRLQQRRGSATIDLTPMVAVRIGDQTMRQTTPITEIYCAAWTADTADHRRPAATSLTGPGERVRR